MINVLGFLLYIDVWVLRFQQGDDLCVFVPAEHDLTVIPMKPDGVVSGRIVHPDKGELGEIDHMTLS